MSVSDPEALTNLYDWLETIPFSRSKKNFARDFSDCVLAAELIKYFFPTLVELHNYPPSNSFEQKKNNWSTLNQKVLRKLDFPLSEVTISELASGSKREATEYFLFTLREKIDVYTKKTLDKMRKKKDFPQNGQKDNFSVNCVEKIDGVDLANDSSDKIKNKAYYIGNINSDSVPRELYDQNVQELLACIETIQILKARVQRLENLLQLKNVTIDRQQQALDKLKASQITSTGKLLQHK